MQFMTPLNEHYQNNPQIMLFFHSKTEVHELESINEACDQSDPKRNPKTCAGNESFISYF